MASETTKQTRRTVKHNVQEDWVREAVAKSGVTPAVIGRELGIDHTQWSRLIRGLRKLQAHEVEPLAKLLGVSAQEVMYRWGLAPTPATVPLVGEIGADGALLRTPHAIGHVTRVPGVEAIAAAKIDAPRSEWHRAVAHWQAPVAGLAAVRLFGKLALAQLAEADGGGEVLGRVEIDHGTGRCRLTPLGGRTREIDVPISLAAVLHLSLLRSDA